MTPKVKVILDRESDAKSECDTTAALPTELLTPIKTKQNRSPESAEHAIKVLADSLMLKERAIC